MSVNLGNFPLLKLNEAWRKCGLLLACSRWLDITFVLFCVYVDRDCKKPLWIHPLLLLGLGSNKLTASLFKYTYTKKKIDTSKLYKNKRKMRHNDY